MKNHKLAVFVLILFLSSIACNTLGEIRTLLTEESNSFGSDGAPTSVSDQGPRVPLDTGEPPSDETLLLLQDTIVPENDPLELADRLQHIENVPETIPAPSKTFQVGDRRSFYVTDTDTNVTSSYNATLRYVGDIVYFCVEDSVDYEQNDLVDLARTFEDEIVPTDREFFGSEWNPGVDNDPHIYILYTPGLGLSTAGYFSSSDEIHPDATEYSNAAEMFVINADNSPLWDEYTYGVLAHEFQHMIHWYRDRNETSWINEGMSELATLLNGYGEGGFAYEYLFDPDLQLTDWPNDQSATSPHYGAAMLFVTYFLERFGSEATQALVGDPSNGLESVDNTLAQLGINDPVTTLMVSADDLVLDWAVANLVADPAVADGRYAYHDYPQVLDFPAAATESLSVCDTEVNNRTVSQYGVDYISIACGGEVTLRFTGSNRTSLLPANAYSGDFAYWSNKGDESDMTLTRAFDLSDLSGPITLSYRTWYDIEEDWDYLYVLASTDNGDNWTFLNTPSGTDTDPLGQNYGFGYTGLSGGRPEWILESVNLSEYAGQEVLIRFEYVTDSAVNGEGLLLDDISIDELDYFADFEQGDGGWLADGFARVQNVLPQTFHLALITFGDETGVQIIRVPETNRVDIPLDFNRLDEAVLVVMGTTRFTRQPAAYSFSFLPY